MVQNRKKHGKNSHRMIHFPTSKGVSEVSKQVNEWAWVERASKASSAEQANKWAVQANKQTDKRVAQYI